MANRRWLVSRKHAWPFQKFTTIHLFILWGNLLIGTNTGQCISQGWWGFSDTALHSKGSSTDQEYNIVLNAARLSVTTIIQDTIKVTSAIFTTHTKQTLWPFSNKSQNYWRKEKKIIKRIARVQNLYIIFSPNGIVGGVIFLSQKLTLAFNIFKSEIHN